MGLATIWITGRGSGIGRSLARSFGRDGYRVAISGGRLTTLAETAVDYPAAIHCHELDVIDAAAADQVVSAIESTLGPIHTAVLNAGVYKPMWVTDFDREMYLEYL